jgi:YidC/Oxa1 family membrane protein insertase
VFDAIATVLAWFYSLVPNYAIAIALLTLTVMVLLTPLTLKGTKSMLQMQRLQPEMKKIQQQYKGDRQKLNEELMKFYQENKINPLGGCLPLLIQMPVFIVLYRVLHGLTATCVDQAMIVAGKCTKVGNFAPKYIDHSTDLWKALTATDQMMAFGMDLSHSAAKELSQSWVGAIPYLVLILMVTASSYIQQLQISARNKNGTAINPQQAMLLKVMPAFFAVISLTLPAGIVVYFLVSNLYRIGQQAYITRAFYREDAKHAAEAASSPGSAGSAKPKPEPKGTPKAIESKASEPKASETGQPKQNQPRPLPKGQQSKSTGNGSGGAQGGGQTARPKPKSSGATARPAPRPVSGGTGGSGSGSTTPPNKNKKKR